MAVNSFWTNYAKKGGLLSAAGEISGALEKSGAAAWNKSVVKYEGYLSETMARLDEKRLRNEVQQTVGTAVANAGASGFTIDSSKQAIDDIIRSGAMDEALIRIRGDIGKWKEETELEQIKSKQTGSYVSAGLNIASSLYGSQ